jgi:hypothetical protein
MTNTDRVEAVSGFRKSRVAASADPAAAGSITLVLNWPTRLKKP